MAGPSDYEASIIRLCFESEQCKRNMMSGLPGYAQFPLLGMPQRDTGLIHLLLILAVTRQTRLRMVTA